MSRSPEGFVLAGGRSQRMGRDKALLPIAGRPMIVHAIEKLQTACSVVRIAGSRDDLGVFAEVIPDLHPGCGPLAGIEAALQASRSALNVFVPVDVPLLPADFLQWMLDRAGVTGAPATVPTVLGFPQPLCAIYHRDLLPGISAALDRRDFKVMRAIEAAAGQLGERTDQFAVEAVWPTQGSWRADPPLYRWFRNLNRPEDLEAIA